MGLHHVNCDFISVSGVFILEFDIDTDVPFGLAAAKDPQLVPDLVKEVVSPMISQKLRCLLLRMLHPGIEGVDDHPMGSYNN